MFFIQKTVPYYPITTPWKYF